MQTSSYQSSAGNYVVIDGKGTRWDYAYMHLLKRGQVKQGQRVKTGDVIGFVGETGNAVGCHLHFELWSPPGWYEGGEREAADQGPEEVGPLLLAVSGPRASPPGRPSARSGRSASGC